MKTAISALIVLALLVLLAQIVLPLGSPTGTVVARKTGASDIETVSSKGTPKGINAAWAGNGRGHFSSIRK
jgi:hypothetical protein